MAKDDADLLDYDGEDDSFGAWFWSQIKTWVPAILIVLGVRAAVVEPFRIPSGSMIPTLEIGDHLLVTKFSYALKAPLPLMDVNLVQRRLPERGDIIVFKYPPNPEVDYIKRVVGLPGDVIEVKDNVLYINGEEQKQTLVSDQSFRNSACHSTKVTHYKEQLGDLQHDIYRNLPLAQSGLANFGPFTVPENQVFGMGDNRDNSSDSRAWEGIPAENIKGKAHFIWLSYDACETGIPVLGEFRFDRFGRGLYRQD